MTCSATSPPVACRARTRRAWRRRRASLRRLRVELVEAERAVVERGREAEAVVDERLPCARGRRRTCPPICGIGLVGLVDEDDEVGGEVVEEVCGAEPGRPAVEVPRVVLDAVAEPELLQHLEVVLGALPDPVGLEHPSLGLELLHLRRRARPGCSTTARSTVGFGGDVLRRREDRAPVSSRESTSPVSGSKCVIASTSSPKNETR